MASTWTDEQTAKLADAYMEVSESEDSVPPGSNEFWSYIRLRVNEGKSMKDVKERFHQANRELFGESQLFPGNEKPDESKISAWTEEERRKLGVSFNHAYKQAFESGIFDFDSSVFWDYIAKEVGGGKTVADCKAKYRKELQDDRKNTKK